MKCKRLQKAVPESFCHACLRDCTFRRHLITQAESNGVEWRDAPCAYECAAGVPEEVSVENNHWLTTTPITPPPLPQRIKNLAGAGKRVIRGLVRDKHIKVTKEVHNTRLDICNSCALFDPDEGVCGDCGCIMVAKAGLAVESCPLGKWKAI